MLNRPAWKASATAKPGEDEVGRVIEREADRLAAAEAAVEERARGRPGIDADGRHHEAADQEGRGDADQRHEHEIGPAGQRASRASRRQASGCRPRRARRSGLKASSHRCPSGIGEIARIAAPEHRLGRLDRRWRRPRPPAANSRIDRLASCGRFWARRHARKTRAASPATRASSARSAARIKRQRQPVQLEEHDVALARARGRPAQRSRRRPGGAATEATPSVTSDSRGSITRPRR